MRAPLALLNVFAATFLATKLENLKILEDQLETVIASLLGTSLYSLTPALNTAANIAANAVIQGSANSFLTLRVGVLTKLYCASLKEKEKGQLRQMAEIQAVALLGKVLFESGHTITKIMLKAAARAGKRPFNYGRSVIMKAAKSADNFYESIGKELAEMFVMDMEKENDSE